MFEVILFEEGLEEGDQKGYQQALDDLSYFFEEEFVELNWDGMVERFEEWKKKKEKKLTCWEANDNALRGEPEI